MLQHLLGGVLLEVDQLKQLDLVTLRGEDQLVLLAVEAHLEGDFVKRLVQNPFHPVHQLLAPGVVLVLVHHSAQLGLMLGKVFPCRFRPLPEAHRKPWPRNVRFAPFDESLGVLIVGAGLQRLVEIRQGPAPLIQVVIRIAHAEVPVVIALKVFLMRF